MYLLLVILLAIINMAYIIFVAREYKLANSGTNLLVVKLKKKFKIDVFIMIALIAIVYYKASSIGVLDPIIIGLLAVFLAVLIYVYLIRRPQLYFKVEGLGIAFGIFDYKDVTNINIVENRSNIIFNIVLFNNKNLDFVLLNDNDVEKIKNLLVDINLNNSAQKYNEFQKLTDIVDNKEVIEIIGNTKDYDWGGKYFLAKLLNLSPNQIIAEYWLGTHPSSVSTLKLDDDNYVNFQSFLDLNNKQISQISSLKSLPFLFKVLDVAKPLSIQLHPTKEQAENGFKIENLNKIKIDAVERVFKDDNHKPELMVALSDFYLLHGFQSKEKTIKLLEDRILLKDFLEIYKNLSIIEMYKKIMTASKVELKQLFGDHFLFVQSSFSDKLNTVLDIDLLDPDYWVAYSMKSFNIDINNIDPGLIAFYIFNLIKLEKHQGIFQAECVPHAYLRGQNVEIMAQSDNVIRGGLTSKHIDIDRLLHYIEYKEIIPSIINVDINNFSEYKVPVNDFTLNAIKANEGRQLDLCAKNASILILIAGSIKIIYNHKTIVINKGQSVFISSDLNYGIVCLEDSELYIASF